MLRKIPFENSGTILERFDLSAEARDLVSNEMAPETVLQVLHKAGLFVDVLHFFGHALPPREGICWALSVITELCPIMDRNNVQVLEKVASWVRDPQEAARIELQQEAEKRNNEDPLAWLCNAVAWNGSGSIGPVGGPVVLPPAGLHASALLGAISLLAGENAESLEATKEASFRLGMSVAQGAWPNIMVD